MCDVDLSPLKSVIIQRRVLLLHHLDFLFKLVYHLKESQALSLGLACLLGLNSCLFAICPRVSGTSYSVELSPETTTKMFTVTGN